MTTRPGRLLDDWHDLRADLAIDPEPARTAEHRERAVNPTGLKARHARGSRPGAPSRGFWGDFAAPGDGEGGDLDAGFRREWARSMLLDRIDAVIAGQEAHEVVSTAPSVRDGPRDGEGVGDGAPSAGGRGPGRAGRRL